MRRADIIAEARKWIGTRYRKHGRNAAGLDCIGLVEVVGDAFNLDYEDLQGYAEYPSDLKFIQYVRKFTVPMPISSYRPGLIGLFRQARLPCHAGIFGEINGKITLINSRADMRKVREDFIEHAPLKLTELMAFPGMED